MCGATLNGKELLATLDDPLYILLGFTLGLNKDDRKSTSPTRADSIHCVGGRGRQCNLSSKLFVDKFKD